MKALTSHLHGDGFFCAVQSYPFLLQYNHLQYGPLSFTLYLEGLLFSVTNMTMKKSTFFAFLGISFFMHSALVLGLVLIPSHPFSRGGAVMDVTLVSLTGSPAKARISQPVTAPSPGKLLPAIGLESRSPAAIDAIAGSPSTAQGKVAPDRPASQQAGSGTGDAPAAVVEAPGGSSPALQTQGGSEPSLMSYNRLIVDIISRNRYYPDSARRRGIEGSVDVRLTIDRTGHACDVRVVKTSGAGILDRASVQAIRGCSFPPPPGDSITLPITITFRLVEGSQS
jgi:TonB family protein